MGAGGKKIMGTYVTGGFNLCMWAAIIAFRIGISLNELILLKANLS